MKLFNLIEEADIAAIEQSLTNVENYSSISFLTLNDKLNTTLLHRLQLAHAILEYDQLFDPRHLKDINSARFLHQSIKILISAWKTNKLYNIELKKRLDYEASIKLAQSWITNTGDRYQSFSVISDYLNTWAQNKSEKWMYNKLSLEENKRMNTYVHKKILEIIDDTSTKSFQSLLRSTFRTHFLYNAILFFKKYEFDSDFSLSLEKDLYQRCQTSATSPLFNKIKSHGFTGVLSDWRSNLLSLGIADEIEERLLSILESSEFPKNCYEKITVLSMDAIIEHYKKNQLDHHLCKYLRSLFKETLKIALLDEIISEKSMRTLASITAEIIDKWQKNSLELHFPYPIEKILLPDLYQLKKRCKQILSNHFILKPSDDSAPVTRDELDQIKKTIANIPRLVERLMNDQFSKISRQSDEDEKKHGKNL